MRLTKYLFPFFVLVIVFADELFACVTTILGIGIESGMKSREMLVIAGVAYVILVIDILNNKVSFQNWKQLGVLLALLFLYIITGFIYDHYEGNYDRYKAYLLLYGASCVPSTYVGIKLARGHYNEELIRLLPYFVLFISIVTITLIRASLLSGIMLGRGDEDTFNYQSASYYMAFCYTYCFYYVFCRKKRHRKETIEYLKTIIMSILFFICAVGCLMGGGRGAFVYIIIVTIYLIQRVIGGKEHNKGTILLLVVAALFMVFLADILNVFQSMGFSRVVGSLTTDEYRTAYWRNAIHSFKESPLFGHGLGSIWWTVGFYSHNIFTDLLAETGVLGLTVVMYSLVKILSIVTKRSYFSDLDMFILLFFLGHLVESFFSGYWFANSALFFSFGYVFSMPKLTSSVRRL